MKKLLTVILTLILSASLIIPISAPAAANPGYTIFIRASDRSGPPGQPMVVPIVWSGTTPVQGGTNNTPITVTTEGGSLTVTAPLTSNNGSLNFFIFRNWVVITPQPPSSPIISPQPTDQRTITFATNANKTAIASYQQVFNLGNIASSQPSTNPLGISHSVYANTGVPVAGVKVNFLIQPGPNSAASGFAYTDATGRATFTWTGTYDGTDAVWAYLDSNQNSQFDSGEPRTNNTINTFWVNNFVTGGGNIKVDKKVAWTFSGTVGVPPEGGTIGDIEIVDHVNNETYTLDQFVVLFFYDDPNPTDATSPPGSHNTARFRGTGTRSSDGARVEMVIVMQDNAEPGREADKIAVQLVRVNGVLAVNGLIGSVNVPEAPGTPLVMVTISGGNFQVHNIE